MQQLVTSYQRKSIHKLVDYKTKLFNVCVYDQISVQELRKKCASYIRSHTDEFSPYIADPDTGEICTPGETLVTIFHTQVHNKLYHVMSGKDW